MPLPLLIVAIAAAIPVVLGAIYVAKNPQGIRIPSWNETRKKPQLDRSEIGDFVSGLKRELGQGDPLEELKELVKTVYDEE